MKTRTLIGSVATAAAIATVAVFLTVPSNSVVTPKAMAQPGPPGITVERLATTLTRVGLTSDNLAAVGADAGDTTAVVVGMRAYLSGDGIALYNADEALASATTTHDDLLREVRRGRRDQETLSALASAKSDLASAQQAVSTQLQTAFDQATAGLTSNQRTLLARIHQNKSAYHMPTDVAAASWTEADWLAMRGAMANVRQNQTPDAGAATTMDDGMHLSDVSTATTNLSNDLDVCKAAWDTAVQTYGGT